MATNGKMYLLLTFLVGVAVANNYGVGSAPTYPAQSPAVPVAVPYIAPSPPVLPELASPHEFVSRSNLFQ